MTRLRNPNPRPPHLQCTEANRPRDTHRPSKKALRHAACVLGIASLLAAGCGGRDESYSASVGAPQSGLTAQLAADQAIEEDFEAVGESGASTEALDATDARSQGRSLIFTGDIEAEFEDTRAALEEISAWVVQRGGFVEQSRLLGSPGAETAYITLRVPQVDYEALRGAVRERAEVVHRDESRRQDVSARRADMDARLANLRLAEEELRELLASLQERDGDTESVLEVYRELSRYRGEIEGLEAQLATLEEQVALSTLRLELRPVPQLAQGEARRWQLSRTVRGAWVDLVAGLQRMAEGLIYFGIAVLPRLLIGVLLLWLAWLVLRPALGLFRWRPGRPKRGRPSAQALGEMTPSADASSDDDTNEPAES